MRFLVACALSAALSTSFAQTLRVGLAEDPDILDPTMARTFVGRIVFAGLCDKLFDLDEKLAIVPQLATSHEWSADNKSLVIKLRSGVTFHDGEKMDAAAVKMDADGWTARTEDGSLSAHFEFSVAVTPAGARVLGTDRI